MMPERLGYDLLSNKGDASSEPELPVIKYKIAVDQLPLFAKAAEETGFYITVIAQVGEFYHAYLTNPDGNERMMRRVYVEDGKLGISITPRLDTYDPYHRHSPFWRALEALEKQPATD